MKLIKIGEKWINLEQANDIWQNGEYINIYFGDYDPVTFYGNEAKALAQLLDNLSTKVMVEE
jgi:hypothetical protein